MAFKGLLERLRLLIGGLYHVRLDTRRAGKRVLIPTQMVFNHFLVLACLVSSEYTPGMVAFWFIDFYVGMSVPSERRWQPGMPCSLLQFLPYLPLNIGR